MSAADELQLAIYAFSQPLGLEDQTPAISSQQTAHHSSPSPDLPNIELEKSINMIINRTNLNNVFTAFKTMFNTAFGGAQSNYLDIAMKVSSATREETYAWLGAWPGIREWVGDRVIRSLSMQGYTIKNVLYESTISVPANDIADDRYGIFTPMFAEMGRTAKMHPDEVVFRLLKNGFDTTCYDGQSFFDTDHPIGKKDGSIATVSNIQDGVGAAWFLFDTSRAVKPLLWQEREPYTFAAMDQPEHENVFMRREYLYGVTARANAGFGLWQLAFASKSELTPENYAAARSAMMAFKDDEEKPLGISPNLLVVPPTLEQSARTVLFADKIEGTSNIWKDTAKLIVTPYLG